jgi:hypothetical protein
MAKEHDALDWFAAIGPTLAAFFAAWVAWRTYWNGDKLQRELARPILSIRHNFQRPSDNTLAWVVELRNDGHSPANIERFSVFVGGEKVELGTIQSPDEYWEGILYQLGALRLTRRASSIAIHPPLAIGAASGITLFNILLLGEDKDFEKVISNLEIRMKFKSHLGEEFDYISRATLGAG